MRPQRRAGGMLTVGISIVAGAMALAACSPAAPPSSDPAPTAQEPSGDDNGTEQPQQPAEPGDFGISDADYSLEALIEAAKQEPPITVVDATGKIVEMAEKFTEMYGVQATGVKMSATEQEEIIIREAEAKNVQTDVFNMSNLPSVTSRILPEGIGISWMPPDLKGDVPPEYQSPAITSNNPWVWIYNSNVATTCPVSNWWEMTGPEWTGKVSIPDPLLRNETMFWLNQIADNGDDLMAQAYEDHFGEPLPADADSATALWVEMMASNRPNIQKSDTDVGPVVGADGQTEDYMGFVSSAIFRNADKDGFHIAYCDGLKPWVGQLTPRVAVIAAGTDSPNAAKLFVHYMMTPEGMHPQLVDGKISTNTTATNPPEEVSKIFDIRDQLYVNNSETTKNDFEMLQYWQDLWIANS